MTARGVALVQALVVVAGLAALAAGVLALARQGVERLALTQAAVQAHAMLDAGAAQARADLAVLLATPAPLAPGQPWAAARDAALGPGRVAWAAQDLQGRFNLGWLADPGPWGEGARGAFLRLAAGQGVAPALAERLARALGPDPQARAAAHAPRPAPDMPLTVPQNLAAIPTLAEGGPRALAPLWPLVAALPPESRWNPLTAPLPVAQALIPGLAPADWAEFDAARAAGAIPAPEALPAWATGLWPEDVVAQAAALPLGGEAAWLAVDLAATLDSRTWRRSLVLAYGPDATGAPALSPVLSLPVFE